MIKASLSIALFSSMLLLACQTTIDPAKVADSIKADTANMTLKTVTRPDNLVAKAGGTFQCQVTDDQGTAGTFTVDDDRRRRVDQLEARSEIRRHEEGWRQPGSQPHSIDGREGGREVSRQERDRQAGLVVVCDATSGDKTQKVTLTGTAGNFDIAMQ
jgi:hypothetical protein